MECAYWETAASAGAGIIPPRAKGARPWQWEAAPEDGFHVLRHTSVVIVLEAGESVVTPARWLGRFSPTVTLSYYAHVRPGGRKQGPHGH